MKESEKFLRNIRTEPPHESGVVRGKKNERGRGRGKGGGGWGGVGCAIL